MDHPNVLQSLAMGERDGMPFMVVSRLHKLLSDELPRRACMHADPQ